METSKEKERLISFWINLSKLFCWLGLLNSARLRRILNLSGLKAMKALTASFGSCLLPLLHGSSPFSLLT